MLGGQWGQIFTLYSAQMRQRLQLGVKYYQIIYWILLGWRGYLLFFPEKISILRMALISIRLNMRDRQSLCIGNLIKSSVLSQKSVLRIKLFSPFGSIFCYVCIMQLKKDPCQAILTSGINLSIYNDWLFGLPMHKQALAAFGFCCLLHRCHKKNPNKPHLYKCTPLIRLFKGWLDMNKG